jgi:hypothetical protein
MASDKTTPTASGIGAGFPLRADREAGGEGGETHLPAPPELPLDLAQVLANQTRLIEVLTKSLENQRPGGGRPQVGLLMAKNPIHSHPYPNLITLISIPHPTKNTRGKLNPTHPITLLIPNQPVIGWKPMENPWV